MFDVSSRSVPLPLDGCLPGGWLYPNFFSYKVVSYINWSPPLYHALILKSDSCHGPVSKKRSYPMTLGLGHKTSEPEGHNCTLILTHLLDPLCQQQRTLMATSHHSSAALIPQSHHCWVKVDFSPRDTCFLPGWCQYPEHCSMYSKESVDIH